ncbi:MAG: hypothetical protein HQL47_01905 [Gammaproteobacteria bacterium]|nr:hypothetical protein [Gammaproteobacteria bacterium]
MLRFIHRHSLKLFICLSLSLSSSIQAKTPVARNEAIPPSGLSAVTAGRQVLLFQDGSWSTPGPVAGQSIQAITAQGRGVSLIEKPGQKPGSTERTWKYSGSTHGMIQVVVSRAIATDRSPHSDTDNCIPTITLRNLSDFTLHRVIAELEFFSKDGNRSAASVMFGSLDNGEEQERVASPLLVPDCTHLSARLHVPYCVFSNGLDCSVLIKASPYGTISLEMATPPSKP